MRQPSKLDQHLAINLSEKYLSEIRSTKFLSKFDLAHGFSGYLLFVDAVFRNSGRSEIKNQLNLISKSIISRDDRNIESLFSGRIGEIWAVDKISTSGTLRDDLLKKYKLFDDLTMKIISTRDRVNFDLTSGLVGMGVYALFRNNAPVNTDLLHEIVSRLVALSSRDADGIYWKTPAGIHPKHSVEHTDLGIAHGTPGVLKLLCYVQDFLPGQFDLRTEIGSCMNWLIQKRNHLCGSSQYSYTLDGCQTSRLGWCYGDLSVALAIAHASNILVDNGSRNHAIEIARNTIKRGRLEALIEDEALCHGSAGIAMMYHELYVSTQHDEFISTSHKWLEGIFNSLQEKGFSLNRVFNNGGILLGSAGLLLILGKIFGVKQPEWSRAFLIDSVSLNKDDVIAL